MKESDKIELRSDEVQEILTRVPNSLIRYGISVICSVIVIIFIGCFFFKYPDIIVGEVVVTTENPPVWLVAKTSGRIKELLVKDKQEVTENSLLAVIENPSLTEDILALSELLLSVKITDSSFYIPDDIYRKPYELGDLQSKFSSFARAAINYDNFLSINLISQERSSLLKKIHGRKDYSTTLQRQLKLKENELILAKSTYDREKGLFAKGVISKAELEKAEQNFLQLQQSLQNLESSIISEGVESEQYGESLKKLSLQYLQEKNQYYTEVRSSYRELEASIEAWKQTYLLKSSIKGTVTFNNYWQKDQFVESGKKVFAIVPDNPGDIIGRVTIAAQGHGKVKLGQLVNIKMNGFPYMEYGMLKSKIRLMSLVPDDDKYSLEVSLMNGLTTTTGEVIDFSGELSGVAEVITDDRSLGQRLISPMIYLWTTNIKDK